MKVDLTLLRLADRLFMDGGTDLEDEYEVLFAQPSRPSDPGSATSPGEVNNAREALKGIYLVLAGLLGSSALVAFLDVGDPLSTALVVMVSLLFGPVAAQAIGHGIIAPVLHRGRRAGGPWGDRPVESATLFLLFSVGFSTGLLLLIHG